MRLALIVLTVVSLHSKADACSIMPEIGKEPTLVEHVEQSFAIVVGKIDKSSVNANSQAVPFIVTDVFKGPIKVGAAFTAFGVVGRFSTCNEPEFRFEDEYMFYLDADKNVRHEHYLGKDNKIFRYAITELVRISAFDQRDKRVELYQAVEKQGHTKSATPEEKELSAIVHQHLDTPTPYKTFAELRPMLDHLPKNDAKTFSYPRRDLIVHAIGLGGDPAAAKFMTEVLRAFRAKKTDLPREDLHAIVSYFAKVTVPTAVADLWWLHKLMDSKWPWRDQMDEVVQRHAIPIHEMLHATQNFTGP